MKTPEGMAQMLEQIRRQFPELAVYLRARESKELAELPYAVGPNLGVKQGRVQSLTELRQDMFGRDNP